MVPMLPGTALEIGHWDSMDLTGLRESKKAAVLEVFRNVLKVFAFLSYSNLNV